MWTYILIAGLSFLAGFIFGGLVTENSYLRKTTRQTRQTRIGTKDDTND